MKLKPLKVDTTHRDKQLEKRDGKVYFVNATGDEKQLIGLHCKAFQNEDGYFFQFDSGHFATQMVDVEIEQSAFFALRSGRIAFDDIYSDCVKRMNAR